MSVPGPFSRRALFAIGLSLLISAGARAGVRPISEAERAAAEIAAGYLERGPIAIERRLSAASPLRKTSNLAAEIEARLGPHASATWELQTVVPALKDRMAAFAIEYPSGVDETAIFEMVLENGRYDVRDIRIAAQRVGEAPAASPASLQGAGGDAGAPQEKKAPLFLGLLAAVVVGGGAFAMRVQPLAGRAAFAAAVITTAFAFVLLLSGAPAAPPARPDIGASQKTSSGFASLLELRRVMAEGTGDVSAAYGRAPQLGDAGTIAHLWKAQCDLQQLRLADVKKTLAKFPSASGIPLVEILRGRVALIEQNESASAMAYEQAVNLGPGRDGLWGEAAQALLALGYSDRASEYFRKLARIGSRTADTYYILALLAASKGEDDAAEKHLRQAWTLRPEERAELVEMGTFWSVLRRPTMLDLISLSQPAEATFATPLLGMRKIELPAGAEARVSGDFLHVKISEQELRVPGGATIAPETAAVVDASAWARAEEQRAIDDFPQLVRIARNAGALAQPALRIRMTRTAAALANQNRWSEIIELTEGISATSEHVPPRVLFLRSIALQHTARKPEARQLLTTLASSRVLQRRNDAQALEELGEGLASLDEFDRAVKMLDRAQSIRQNPMIDERVRQIEMNRRLATKASAFTTEHFEVRFPEDVSQVAAQQIASILEAEYKRLQAWIPTPSFQRVTVNVLWWQEFRNTYTGGDYILGFYNGKITVPFAGVGAYVPEVVTILTHELAHAMIAQATNDQAPRWFQEGLAQRLEMRPFHENAFNMYDDNRLLAVALLDPVLGGSPDPEMIGQGYVTAQTLIRFIESKYGTRGLARLIEAFRGGATTEQAIRHLSGMSVPDFDNELRAWGRSGSRVFENPPPVRYDDAGDVGMRWSRRNS